MTIGAALSIRLTGAVAGWAVMLAMFQLMA